MYTVCIGKRTERNVECRGERVQVENAEEMSAYRYRVHREENTHIYFSKWFLKNIIVVINASCRPMTRKPERRL